MNFTYTEKNGDQPLEKWFSQKIAEHAKSKYGLELVVEVTPLLPQVILEEPSAS